MQEMARLSAITARARQHAGRRAVRNGCTRTHGHLSGRRRSLPRAVLHPRRLLALPRKEQLQLLAEPFNEAGITLVVVEYSLCPHVTIDQIVADAHGASLGLKTSTTIPAINIVFS